MSSVTDAEACPRFWITIYLKESVEDIRIRVPKGDKAKIQEHAANMEESTNAFVVRTITETMNRDNNQSSLTPIPDKE